jgi:ribonuclease E
MRDEDIDTSATSTTTRRRAASRPAGPPAAQQTEPQPRAAEDTDSAKEADKPAAGKSDSAKARGKKSTGKKKPDGRKPDGKKSGAKKKATKQQSTTEEADAVEQDTRPRPAPTSLLFQAPDPATAVPVAATASNVKAPAGADGSSHDRATDDEHSAAAQTTSRRRRSRGRGRAGDADTDGAGGPKEGTDDEAGNDSSDQAAAKEGSTSHRRRRRGGGNTDAGGTEGSDAAVSRSDRNTKSADISGVEGSTRIEAKKQRRREGREAGRRRPPILSESEFLARRESVERVMVIRQHGDVTQIAVLEDNVLVEHYVNRESQTSMIGNVYLGRVQNVLPSMEAAFIDIGRGRNAVLYAGEVNWDLLGEESSPRKIESALKPGQSVLVQVSKDPVGHKGARLTSQISLPGRYLVYVPDGTTSGISRKLPENERTRLKNILKGIVPDEARVIIRTAAEGASEEELTRDVTRLTARWDDIESKVKSGQAPQLLYAEPDTTIKVVRDLFTEDFAKLIVSGEDAWDMVEGYVSYVAPHLMDRLQRYDGEGDAFTNHRIDEQIAKALEQKVWLPSGGSLVIDRTEAMTVIDVNTGKFTGSGGNLEETVTKNNLEAAEEIVRQLRLRDVGGIIVIDFIDMVLESNRDLVLRRLVECLGRDRTRHQVAEVTSLGLVQMTRKRIGTGLLEAFGEPCEHCHGRGVIVHSEPVEPKKSGARGDQGARGADLRRRGRPSTPAANASAKTDDPSVGTDDPSVGTEAPEDDSAGSDSGLSDPGRDAVAANV